MKKPILLLFAFLFALFIACTEDDSSEDIPEPQNKLLLKSYAEDGVTRNTYTYDAQDRLQNRIAYTDGGQYIFNEEFKYVNDTMITERFYGDELSQVEKQYKDENGVYHRYFYNDDGTVRNYYVYDQEGMSCGIRTTYRYYSNGNLWYRNEYVNTDENCSFKMTRYNETGQLWYTVESVRDEKNEPWQSIRSPFLNLQDAGNIVSTKHNDNEGSLVYKYAYEHEYNEDDYPARTTRTDQEGETTVYTFEYY